MSSDDSTHDRAWTTTSFPNEEYVVSLDPTHVEEIKKCLAEFKGLGLGPDSVNTETFPLPILRRDLDKHALDVHKGRGFVVIRGLNPADYSADDNVLVHLAVSTLFGDVRGLQSKSGNMLTHITDYKAWTVPENKRYGIHTPGALAFHTDMGCSTLSLHTRGCAKEGGSTYLASAETICQKIRQINPRVLALLAQSSWPIQISAKRADYVRMPLVQRVNNRYVISFDPGRLGRHPATGETISSSNGGRAVPDLTADQQEALRLLSETAAQHRVKLDLKPGDILYANNWAIMHSRDPYVDAAPAVAAATPTPAATANDAANGLSSGRHLVRLWLHDTRRSEPVPSAMSVPWLEAFPGLARLIPAHEFPRPAAGRACRPVYQAQPDLVYKVPLYATGSAAFPLEEDDTVTHEVPRSTADPACPRPVYPAQPDLVYKVALYATGSAAFPVEDDAVDGE